eukprot:40079-Chlamydomonas_euryale.AAC.2
MAVAVSSVRMLRVGVTNHRMPNVVRGGGMKNGLLVAKHTTGWRPLKAGVLNPKPENLLAAQFRAAVEDAKGYFVENRPDFLARFKALGLVGQAASKVTLAGVRLSARVLSRLHVDEQATDALHDLQGLGFR